MFFVKKSKENKEKRKEKKRKEKKRKKKKRKEKKRKVLLRPEQMHHCCATDAMISDRFAGHATGVWVNSNQVPLWSLYCTS
jgi:hypothetical protein